MLNSLPQNLNYSDVKPIGFPSQIRQEKFTPIAFNTSTTGVSSSDVIRFNLSTNGFWDPYSAYIKIEVDVSTLNGINSGTYQTAGSIQIDNSASSFINQLIISKGGVEIERIEEYDTVACILNDINGTLDNRQARTFEGLSANQMANQFGNSQILFGDPGTGTNVLGWSPLQLWIPGIIETDIVNQTNGTSATILCRYEYTRCQLDSFSTISTSSVVQTGPVGGQNLQVGNVTGFQKPFNPFLSALQFEPILTPNFNSLVQYKGLSAQSVRTVKQTFCVPLISGLLGVLMPKESYKYIPMKALQDLILEFRLNPHAMFTSGYDDGAQSLTHNSSGSTAISTYNQIQRNWRITRFEINCEMQYFEPSIENIILSQLNTEKGIVIHSQSWMLGPRYQISSNTAPNGTYQVNLGFESLKNLIWVFMPDDFQTYNYCRKQYRLSANIQQIYLKIGTEYFPPLPITGHAGTPHGYTQNETDANNSEFIIQLYKSFGKFHDINNGCSINPINFSVNQRVYDPANTIAPGTGQFAQFDTFASLPLFHENRCVGRAVYAMNLETLNQDFSVISGINTIQNRPFEINLKADTSNAFTRPYTMYVFCNYDMLIQLKSTGVNILGKG